MKNNYGIAVIGAGARGTGYSKAWSTIDSIGKIAICDILEDRAVKLKTEYNYRGQYHDYKEAINAKGVDIVTICTPTALHPEIAVYAMEQGKHVITEKPMALSVTSAEKMIAAAQQNKVQLALGFQYRNRPDYRLFKKVIDENLIGTPFVALFNDIRHIRSVVSKPAMHDAKTGNGGPLVDMFCHISDLMRWFSGAEPVRVMAKDFTFAARRGDFPEIDHLAPDTGTILVEYSSGTVLSINLCWGLPVDADFKTGSLFKIFGPKGIMEDKIRGFSLTPEEEADTKDPTATVVNRFLTAVKGNGQVQASGQDGLIALATSLAALKSAADGGPVEIEDIMLAKPHILDIIGENKATK